MDQLYLLGSTRRKIVNLLLLKPRTAKEVASILAVQTSAARKHLEALRESGISNYEYARLGVGRPRKVFALTEKGRTLFPMRYAELLNILLENMISRNRGEADQAIAQIAEAVGKEMNPSGKMDREHLTNLTAALNEFGFVTSLEEDEDSYSIISNSCPLYQTASKRQPLICHGFHDGLIRSALAGRDVKLQECMVLGGDRCRHAVTK